MMKSLCRILSLAAMLLLMAIPASAATISAADLVATAAAKLRSAPSVSVAFTASGPAAGSVSRGTFTIAADRFKIDSPDARIWYDGKTQWAWSAASGEVNITEPTIEEIAEVNPLAILNSLRTRYKASYLGNPSQRTVVLTPAMPDPPVTRAEIAFGADGYPTRMILKMPSGDTVTIRVTSVKTGAALPASTFRFTPGMAPGAEVVDLR